MSDPHRRVRHRIRKLVATMTEVYQSTRMATKAVQRFIDALPPLPPEPVPGLNRPED